mmetsp:Transcript_14397/g.36832  ORF Transcript_14397/g.36832 Transcript_14397/m.36832 type:complete len:234 (-) Transcript_14397:807-1508(-)
MDGVARRQRASLLRGGVRLLLALVQLHDALPDAVPSPGWGAALDPAQHPEQVRELRDERDPPHILRVAADLMGRPVHQAVPAPLQLQEARVGNDRLHGGGIGATTLQLQVSRHMEGRCAALPPLASGAVVRDRDSSSGLVHQPTLPACAAESRHAHVVRPERLHVGLGEHPSDHDQHQSCRCSLEPAVPPALRARELADRPGLQGGQNREALLREVGCPLLPLPLHGVLEEFR